MPGSGIAVAGAPEEWAHAASIRQIESAEKLERNLVIHLVALETGRRLAGAAAAATTAFTAAAIQHGQFAAEILQHDLGGVFLLPVLVGPFAGLKLALDINLGTLAQIFLRHIRQVLVEDHHPVPLSLLFALAAGLVAPAFGGGHGQVHHRFSAGHAADLRVLAQIADQNHLVDATCHAFLHYPAATLDSPVRPRHPRFG